MLYRTQYMKRKFGTGGYGAVAGMVGSVVDSLTPENQYGRKSVAATTFKGLTTGASMGAQFGPWGAAAGAVIGGVTGLISGKNAKRKENVMLNAEEIQRKQMEQNEMGAAIQTDPSLYQGYRDGQYMKTGGKLKPLVKPAASSIDTVRPPGAPSLFKASMAEMIRDQKAKAALQKARDNAPVLKQVPDTRDEFEKRYGMTRVQYMKRKFQGTLTPQTEEKIQKRINNEGNTAIQGVTNLTQFVPGPIGWVSAVAGMALGARDAVEDFGKGDNVNGTLDVVGALPWIPGAKQMGILGKAAKKYAKARAASNAGNATGFAADYTNNFGQGDDHEYETGGMLPRPKLSKGGWATNPKPQDLINGLIQKRDSGEITLEEYGRTYREYLTSPQGQAYVKTTYPKSGYSMTYRDEKSPTKQSTWALPDKEAFDLMTKGNPGYNPQTVTVDEVGGTASGYLNVPKKANGGSLWETNKPAYVDSTLAANKKLDFVKRMYDKNPKTIQVPGQPNKSTHLMAYDPGTKRAYPEVVNQGGNLKHLQGDAAWDYADSTGEFIEFPRAEQAKWFATNGYKQGTGVLKRATGGSLKPISSDGVDVQGASHAQGGVQLPQAEVEGGETIKDDYVFSKQLGFAQLHRPIMRAKGKIEAKPATKERMNSIKLLNEKEGMLEKAQEFFKQKYGYQ